MKDQLSAIITRIGSTKLIMFFALFPMFLILIYLGFQWQSQSTNLKRFVDQSQVLQSDLEFMSTKTTGSDFLSKTKDQILEGDIKEKFGFQSLKNKFINSELTKNGVRGAKEEALKIGKNGVDTIDHSKLNYIMTRKKELTSNKKMSKEDLQEQADLKVEIARRKRMGLPTENIEKGLIENQGLSFKEKLAMEKQRASSAYQSRHGSALRAPVNLTTVGGQEEEKSTNNRSANRERKKKVTFFTEISKPEKAPKELFKKEEKEIVQTDQIPNFAYEPMQAIIDQRLKIQSGDKVQIRLLSDYHYKGVELKRNSILYGIASLSGNRAKITINSLNHNGSILPSGLNVYDTDGMLGIYINSNFDELSKEVISEGLNEASNGLDVKVPLVGFSLKLGKKKNRESSAFIPAGYPVLLYDPLLDKLN